MDTSTLIRKVVFALGLSSFVLLLFVGDIRVVPSTAHGVPAVEVDSGPLQVWLNYSGEINSQRVTTVANTMSGSATLIELVEEGAQVEKEQVLARFDSAEIEQQVIKLEREATLASTDLDSLVHGKIPMELAELSASITEVQGRLGYEKTYLKDSKRLLAEDIVSPQEVEKQQSKVNQLSRDHQSLTTQQTLTIQHLHPLAVKHAEAKVSAAEQALELAKSQLLNSVVFAPASGVVVYKPLHFGSEYRAARAGDIIYANQQFMMLPDMQQLQVSFYIPESELSKLQLGQEVVVNPISYSDTQLKGTVSHISTAAQKRPNKPQWQRYFQVAVHIEQSDHPVRPGMSVVVHVLSYNNLNAIRIPRRMVNWSDQTAFVYLDSNEQNKIQNIDLGQANAEFYEVISGLNVGDKVVTK